MEGLTKEYKKATKAYLQEMNRIFDSAAALIRGGEAPAAAPAAAPAEEEEEAPVPPAPVKKEKEKKRPREEVEPSFRCPGHVWRTPPTPCVPGPKASEGPKDVILADKTRVKVCADCAVAKTRDFKKLNATKKKAAAAAVAAAPPPSPPSSSSSSSDDDSD